MKMTPIRELRVKPGKVWKDLRETKELVITSRGQPVAIMVPVTADDLEDALRFIRQARFQGNIRKLQQHAARKGLDKLTMEEIDEEIRQTRQAKKARRKTA